MASVSLCLIVRDEEPVLARCLASVRDLVEEIVVVDTGSTDATPQIAATWADRVERFSWCDDFAAARNFSFHLGTCDYLMWMDADDVLDPADRERFRELKEALGPEDADVIFMPYRVGLDQEGNPALVYDRERLVRRTLGLRWQGAVHECIAPTGRIVRWDAAVTHRKTGPGDADRNLRIYEQLLSKGKTLSPREQFYYARELIAHSRDQEAAECLESFLSEGRGWLENILQACLDLAGCLERLGREQESFQALTRALCYAAPRPELCCEIGRRFFQRQDWTAAAYWYRQALECAPGEQGFSQPDCRGYLPLLQLCVCAYRQGDISLSASYNRQALACRPESEICRNNERFFPGDAKIAGSRHFRQLSTKFADFLISGCLLSDIRKKEGSIKHTKYPVFKPAALLMAVLTAVFAVHLVSTPLFARAAGSEEDAVKAVIETFLRNCTEKAMLYTDTDLTAGTVSAPDVLQLWGDGSLTFRLSGKDVTLAELRENITFAGQKARFYAAMRQMQGISREDLRLDYKYPKWELEENTGHITVTETASFRYTDSQRLSVYETTYSISLVKLGEQWLVADASDGCRFEGLYKDKPDFDLNAVLAENTANFQTESCLFTAPYDTGEFPNGCIVYNGANAAAYAYTYSRQVPGTERADFYNQQFTSYAGQGGDCMNFVSQCMWAGFGGSQTQAAITGHALPMDTAGDFHWYGRSAASDGSDSLSWISCKSFRKYLTGSQDGSGTSGSNAGNDGGMYAAILDVGAGSPITGVPVQALTGAAAHVEGEGGLYSHAIIFTDAVGTKRSDIWFCSHTKDLTHIKLGDYYFGPLKVYIPRYLRAEETPFIQMDRLPPVAVSSTAVVGFHTAGGSAGLTLTVTAPDGTSTQPVTVSGSDTCSLEYTFSMEGLYRVDCHAVSAELGKDCQTAFYVRCYQPVQQTSPVAGQPALEPQPDIEPPDWLFS